MLSMMARAQLARNKNTPAQAAQASAIIFRMLKWSARDPDREMGRDNPKSIVAVVHRVGWL